MHDNLNEIFINLLYDNCPRSKLLSISLRPLQCAEGNEIRGGGVYLRHAQMKVQDNMHLKLSNKAALVLKFTLKL